MTVTAVVTMTRALNEPDAQIGIAALTALDGLGLPIFASDAHSIPTFRDAVDRLPNLRRQPDGSGLIPQIKTALRGAAAAGHRHVLYTEPDKRDFFAEGARDFVSEAGRREAAICIAARDEASFSTFPPGQQATERAVNQVASVLLAPLPDLLYGPLVLDLEAVLPYVDAVADDLIWGWRIYVIARAVRSRMPVQSVVGSFPCPIDQRDEDDTAARVYRIEQARQCLQGLRLGLRDA